MATLSLKEARARAGQLFAKVGGGIDPKREAEERRRQAAIEVKRNVSYSDAVEDFIAKHAIGRRGNATWKEQRRVLLKHGAGFDALRNVTKADILRALDGLMAEGKPYMANRTYAAMSTFFRWCDSRDLISVSPMYSLERPFEGEATRTRVYTDEELRAIWKAANKLPQHFGALIKLLMLTGKRKGTVAAMRWDDIDSETWIWTPPQPATRKVGNKRNHPNPLPRLAQRVLKSLPDTGRFVFPGTGGHMAPATWLQTAVREHSGVNDFICHAIRHTVETRMAKLQILPHVRDLCLDHAPARGAGAGYDHHAYHDEMRAAFEAWAGDLEALVTPKNIRRLR